MRFPFILRVFNTFALRGLGSGVVVLFTILVSRYLTTESAARFFLLFNISTIAAICFRWGLDEVIIRRMAKLPANETTPVAVYLTALSHRRVIIWVGSSLLLVLVFQFPALRNLWQSIAPFDLAITLCAAALVALTACYARIMQGVGHINLATFLLNIVVPGLLLLCFLSLLGMRIELNSSSLVLLYAGIAALVYLVTTIACYGNPRRLLASGFRLPWLGFDSLAANKLGVVVLAQQIVGWTALLVVPYFYGELAYKGFVVAQKVSTLISLIMLAINFTFSARFASLYASGKLEELRRMILASLLAIIVASFIIILCLFFLRSWVFSYAKLDSSIEGLFMILLVSQVFFAIAALFSVVLSMAHDDNYLFFVQPAINGFSALAFVILAQFLSLESASLVLVGSYLALGIALGVRVQYLTGLRGEEHS